MAAHVAATNLPLAIQKKSHFDNSNHQNAAALTHPPGQTLAENEK